MIIIFVVEVDVKGSSVIFSDYPDFTYNFVWKDNTWSVNGWKIITVSQNYGIIILHKPGEVNAFWIRDRQWFINFRSNNVPNNSNIECPTCLDHFNDAQVISCPNGHVVCFDDLNNYVKLQSTPEYDINEIQKTQGRIKCYRNECERIYRDDLICLALSPESRSSYIKRINRYRVHNYSQRLF